MVGAFSPLLVFAINIFIQTLLFAYPSLESLSIIEFLGNVFQNTALYIGSVLSWYDSLSTRSFAFSPRRTYRSYLKARFTAAFATLVLVSILLGVIATAIYEILKWIRRYLKNNTPQ